MTLAQDIADFNITAAQSTPADVADAFKNAIQDWVSNRIDKEALQIGDEIPSFSLRDTNDKIISSNTLLSQGPMIITFYRGGWCPYCNLELQSLQKHLQKIKLYHGSLVAISAELPDHSITTLEKNKLAFPVLFDRNLQISREFGLVFTLPKVIEDMTKNIFGLDLTKINGTDAFELPIPASYVIDSDHIIHYAFVNPDFMQRGEPSKMIEILKRLQKN